MVRSLSLSEQITLSKELDGILGQTKGDLGRFSEVWQACLEHLRQELSQSEFDTWIKPIQLQFSETHIELLCPNEHVRRRVESDYLQFVEVVLNQQPVEKRPIIRLRVGIYLPKPPLHLLLKHQKNQKNQKNQCIIT